MYFRLAAGQLVYLNAGKPAVLGLNRVSITHMVSTAMFLMQPWNGVVETSAPVASPGGTPPM